ncbi:hypothetical protein [Streptomyces sp. NPDC101178]|uniref:hypothetical protein n=1 Tax=Streptomyces sp. NPDC101178 TaxID=3366124 RepID=UPI0037F7DD30
MADSGDRPEPPPDSPEGAADPAAHALLAAAVDAWADAIVANDAERIAAFMADEWTTDVFVRGGGHWRCVLSHITPAAPPEGS